MNGCYFDSAYVAKCYLNEPDSQVVREFARSAGALYTSSLAIAEIACVLHRHLREGALKPRMAIEIRNLFLEDIQEEIWQLIPVSDHILRHVEKMVSTFPRKVFLRAGDAIHMISAIEAGFNEIWTNDRHLLAAAVHSGIKGRSIES